MKTDINIYLVLTILLIHWVADFLMQDEQWATNKSKSIKALLAHTTTYSLFWSTIGFLSLDMVENFTKKIILFTLITFVIHTITDYFTSRLNSKLYAAGRYGSSIPNLGLFTAIGMDQWLHFAQLLLTYQLIFNNG